MLPPWPFKSTIRWKPWADKVIDQVAEKVEICPRRGRERAGEIHVVVRVAQPEQRASRPRDRRASSRQANDFAQQHAVGENGQWRPCCSRAAIGTTTGSSFATAATFGQLKS